MNSPRHSISIHYGRVFLNCAQRIGLDLSSLMKHAGINQVLLSNPDMRVTPEQLSRLTQQIWLTGDDEFMGMTQEPCRHGVFALMARHAVHCHNLREVIQHICRFYNLFTDALQLEFSIDNHQVHFGMKLAHPEKDSDYLLRELLLLIWHRFPSWLIGKRIELSHVGWDFPEPSHCGEYRLMYPCETRFNQAITEIVFDEKWLSIPVVQTHRTLIPYLKRAPLDWFKRQAYYPVFTRKVLDCLEQTAQPAGLTMEQVSLQLHITVRTLRRKLADEGTSFQFLKDSVRRDTAIHYLSTHTQPIAEISRLLGFSEPAAFARAFKQWTGVSPSTYRDRS